MSGYIGYRKVPTLADGGGAWPLSDVAKFRKDQIWPNKDTYYDKVGLLLPMEGANNSTTFTDFSLTPKTVTRIGDTKISTTQSKWGNGSGYFDGTGDLLQLADATDWQFGTGDFTVENWVYLNTVSGFISFAGNYSGALGGWLVFLYSGDVYFRFGDGNMITRTVSGGISTGNWHHIAVSRASGLLYLFFNGALLGSSASFSVNITYTNPYGLSIGCYTEPNGNRDGYLNGYLQDLRITKGVARYTATFDPPGRLL